MKHTKIAIIGAGSVGSTTAYALLLKNVAAEIMLIDIDEIRCKGETLDLSDALPFCKPSKITKKTFKDAAQADIIIITAGARQKQGQSRIDLLQTNKKIIQTICNNLQPLSKHAIVIIITNPVDLMTYHAQQCLSLPKKQIFGSGTMLDTQRLRSLLSEKLSIAEQSIDAYILGEHGDTQFAVLSSAQVDGMKLLDFPEITSEILFKLENEAKNRAQEIIDYKGATYFGIAACVATICEAIVYDQKLVTPLSCFQEQFGVCLSMPVVIGAHGIEKQLEIALNPQEQEKLAHSAQSLKGQV